MADEDTIRQMAVDLAVIKDRVEALPQLVARIDALEKHNIKSKAYVAAASAITGVVVWLAERLHLLMPFVAFLAAMLISCASPRVVQDGPRWPDYRRPVYVKIDEGMSPECLASVDYALRWWSTYVDYLIPEYVPSGDISVSGLARLGEIGISQGNLSPGTAGETRYARVPALNTMLYADITLEVCSPETAAHELGHALGLKHEDATVTCWTLECHEWYLSPQQEEHVK